MSTREYQVCTNCVMDTTDSVIQFDEKGVCDHCHNYYENILPNWHPDEQGRKKLDEIVAQIKKDGQGKKYDCIIAVSYTHLDVYKRQVFRQGGEIYISFLTIRARKIILFLKCLRLQN